MNEIVISNSGRTISSSNDEEILKSIAYGLLLIGTPKDNYPKTDIEKTIILNFIRRTYSGLFLSEIQLAFEYAVENRIKVELKLYGADVSANYISNIIAQFLKYKNNIITTTTKPKETGMTNMQQATSILSMLKEKAPETFEHLKKIGIEKKEEPKIYTPLPNNDKFQKYMVEFKELQEDSPAPDTNGSFVIYKNEIFGIKEYCEFRLQEEL